jgi:hypothetical protein
MSKHRIIEEKVSAETKTGQSVGEWLDTTTMT